MNIMDTSLALLGSIRPTRQLLRDGAPIQLTAKAFDTLVVLVANHGLTVIKDELMDAVWGDTAVEENNLTQQISALRKALGQGRTRA